MGSWPSANSGFSSLGSEAIGSKGRATEGVLSAYLKRGSGQNAVARPEMRSHQGSAKGRALASETNEGLRASLASDL